ncbi:MAG: aspartate carbamoyltransferase catalytic subunit, partial [Frankiaceae bacterium]|nr:aspartate carbamoyltransferase catalytic subunit [Frankiaceae bacterium]
YFPNVREYSRRYGLDARRISALPDDAIVMHPGPMNRGVEIAAEVADSARSTIVEQVANGVSVRMAVLYLLLGGSAPAIGSEGPTNEGRIHEGRAIEGRAIEGGAND